MDEFMRTALPSPILAVKTQFKAREKLPTSTMMERHRKHKSGAIRKPEDRKALQTEAEALREFTHNL